MNSVKTNIRKRKKEHLKKRVVVSYKMLGPIFRHWYLSEYLLIHCLFSIVQHTQHPRWQTSDGQLTQDGLKTSASIGSSFEQKVWGFWSRGCHCKVAWTHLGSESCLESWREREGEEGLGWKLRKSRDEHIMKGKGARRKHIHEPAKFLRAL